MRSKTALLAIAVALLLGGGGQKAIDHYFKRSDRRGSEQSQLLTGYKDFNQALIVERDKLKMDVERERKLKHEQSQVDQERLSAAEEATFQAIQDKNKAISDLQFLKSELERCKMTVENLHSIVNGFKKG